MSDLKRVYVTEAEVNLAQTSGPTIEWVSIGCYDTEAEALQHAQDPAESRNTRVRQFWVESGPMTTVAGTPPSKEALRAGAEAVEAMVDMVCLDHPECEAKSWPGGAVPRCPTCRTGMVRLSVAKNVWGHQ